MGWRRIFRGRRLRRSMRSCMRSREPLADCRHRHKVQEWPLPAPDNRTAGRGKARTPRGKAQETKSLLKHLINATEKRGAAARLASWRGQRTWLTAQFKRQPMEISKPRFLRQVIFIP